MADYCILPTIKDIRKFVQRFEDGIPAVVVAEYFGMSDEELVEFIAVKRDQYGYDPYTDKRTKVGEMEEAIQIKLLPGDDNSLWMIHLTHLGMVERYRGAWGYPEPDERPVDPLLEELGIEDPYGSMICDENMDYDNMY